MRFQKKYVYLQCNQKTIIMESNYRITVILKEDVLREEFATKEIAKGAIVVLQKLYPDKFISGALEERGKWWKVIWVLTN